MLKTRAYLLAACVLLFFMGIVPLAEAFLSTLPGNIGNVAWRYGAVGVITEALALPLTALVFSAGLALAMDWRIPMRLLALLAALGSLISIVLLPLFVLDALQLRGAVRLELRRPFDMAAVLAAFRISVAAVLGWMVAWGGWRSAARSTRHRQAASAPVLAGTRRPGDDGSGHAPDTNRPGDG
jgi:hypothetical protein